MARDRRIDDDSAGHPAGEPPATRRAAGPAAERFRDVTRSSRAGGAAFINEVRRALDEMVLDDHRRRHDG